jgi:hypothetical protein
MGSIVRDPSFLILAALFSAGSASCVDLRDFEGTWSGSIVAEEAVRQGFAPDVRATALSLADVDLRGMTADLTTSDGKFGQSRLQLVRRAESDALATLRFDGSPLRTFLMFSPLSSESAGSPAWFFISLFGDDRVELRVIRGNDLFGVFDLRR